MLRASHIPPIASPALCALRLSFLPALSLSSPPHSHSFSTSPPLRSLLSKTHFPNSPHLPSAIRPQPVGPPMSGHARLRGPGPSALFSGGASSGSGGAGRELLVQHLLVKEDDQKLLLELQQRVASGEDLSDLAVEYSMCPSKEEGGMLGWVRKGQMVPEFEEAAFSAPLNKVVRCKTKFGWHLLQVLSEREEAQLLDIEPEELQVKMQDPNFIEKSQLIDIRKPDEVDMASLPGFQVFPLRQFGSWGPQVTTKLDTEQDTYVMCHHGMRSLQVAKWLQTQEESSSYLDSNIGQGFKRVYNLTGGIHAYAVKADPSVPTY